MIFEFQTEHLRVDVDGDVWLWLDSDRPRPFRRLGPIEWAEIPDHVPAGLEAELLELLDAWHDDLGRRQAELAERRATFRRQAGF